jgi:site-specific recombinase XerD
MLFGDALDLLVDYMVSIDRSERTIYLYRRDLLMVKRFIEELHNGPIYIEDVTQNDLEAFMRYTKEVKNYSPNSRSNLFYTLRTFYAFCYKKEIVPRDIAVTMDFMKMPKKERFYLTEEEAEKVIAAISNKLVNLIATFLFNTGLRISECLNLKMDDVDFKKRTIHIREGKGRKDRIVPINNRLYDLLIDYRDNWREGHNSDFFFSTKKTGTVSYPHVNSTIHAAGKSAGIKNSVSCHILRHSFASALVKKNVNLVHIQKLLGHESLAVTSIYTHTNLEALSDAVNALHD